MMDDPDIERVVLALKYPDYHKWRNLDAALARGGFWDNGETVRLSDPEMRPRMDELHNLIKNDPEFRKKLLQDYTEKLNLSPK